MSMSKYLKCPSCGSDTMETKKFDPWQCSWFWIEGETGVCNCGVELVVKMETCELGEEAWFEAHKR